MVYKTIVQYEDCLPVKSSVPFSQGDIFSNIEIIENIEVKESKLIINKICFPFVVCLNQECDLENDYFETNNRDRKLLHLAIAPAFNFEQFLSGTHWGAFIHKIKDVKGKIQQLKQ